MVVSVFFDPDCSPAEVLPWVLPLIGETTRLDLLLQGGEGSGEPQPVDLTRAAELSAALDTAVGHEHWTAEPEPADAPKTKDDKAEESEPRVLHVRALRFGGQRATESALAVVQSESATRVIVVQPTLANRSNSSIHRRRVFLAGATCEVLILRPGETVGTNAILGVARGPHAKAALAGGFALAQHLGGEATAVVVEPPVGEDAQGVGGRILDRVVGRALGEHASEARRSVIIDDHAARGLEHAAERDPSAWVWVGTSRRSRLGRYFRSTTPLRLAQTCPTMTLVVVRAAAPLAGRMFGRLETTMLQRVPQLGRDDRVALVERVQSNSHWDFDFKALMCLSTLIAAFGLVANAPAVIIGAMLVAPLMTPLLGMGLALVQGNAHLARLTSRSVVAGFVTAFVLGWVVGILTPGGVATEEMRMRNWPGLVDLAVAVVSGLAAAYASSRPNLSSALPGVAIAAALVPPLATAGIALSMGDLSLCLGATLLFLSNLVAIVLASAAALWAVGLRTGHTGSKLTRTIGAALSLAAIGLVAWLSFAPPAYKTPFSPTDAVRETVRAELGDDYELVGLRYERIESPRLLSIVGRGAMPPTPELAERLRAALALTVGAQVEIQLEIRLVVQAGPPAETTVGE